MKAVQRKSITLTFGITMLIASISTNVISQNSQAAVGLITAQPEIMAVGGIISVAGIVAIGVCEIHSAAYSEHGGGGWFSRVDLRCLIPDLMGLTSVVTGLVVLEENKGSPLEFASLTDSQAKTLGITQDQALAYNSELDEINAMKESVVAELYKTPHATQENAHALWQEMQKSISNDAFSALEKISARFVQLANQSK